MKNVKVSVSASWLSHISYESDVENSWHARKLRVIIICISWVYILVIIAREKYFCNFSRFSLTNSEHKSLCNKTALLLTKRRIYRRKKALVTEKYVTWVHELQAHKRTEWINKCGKYEEKKYCIKGIEWHYIYLCVCWVSFSRGWCFFYLGLVHKFWRIFSLQKNYMVLFKVIFYGK